MYYISDVEKNSKINFSRHFSLENSSNFFKQYTFKQIF